MTSAVINRPMNPQNIEALINSMPTPPVPPPTRRRPPKPSPRRRPPVPPPTRRISPKPSPRRRPPKPSPKTIRVPIRVLNESFSLNNTPKHYRGNLLERRAQSVLNNLTIKKNRKLKKHAQLRLTQSIQIIKEKQHQLKEKRLEEKRLEEKRLKREGVERRAQAYKTKQLAKYKIPISGSSM